MTDMKKAILIFLIITITLPALPQVTLPNTSGVKWLTLEQAEKLMTNSPKPLFIDTSLTGADGAKKWTRILSVIR